MQPTPGNITRDYEEERGRAKKEKCERRAPIKKSRRKEAKSASIHVLRISLRCKIRRFGLLGEGRNRGEGNTRMHISV